MTIPETGDMYQKKKAFPNLATPHQSTTYKAIDANMQKGGRERVLTTLVYLGSKQSIYIYTSKMNQAGHGTKENKAIRSTMCGNYD
jgi:hypothetical protein